MLDFDNLIDAIHTLLVNDADIISAFGAANVHKWKDVRDYKAVIAKPFINIMPLPATMTNEYPRGAISSKHAEDLTIFVEIVTNYDPTPANVWDIIVLTRKALIVLTGNNTIIIGTGKAVLSFPISYIPTNDVDNNMKIFSLEITYKHRT